MQKKTAKKSKHKIPKIPEGEKEPQTARTKYEEEPIIKGKSKYSEEEESEL